MITGVTRIGCNRQEGGFCLAPRKSFITLLVGCVLLVAPPSFAAALIDQVTVGYSSFSGAYVPLWVAVEEQLGRKYGLELKAIYAGRVRPQQLLASGEVPFVIATGTGALSSHILGVKDQVIILTFINKVNSGLFTRANIKSAEDLKGKRLQPDAPERSAIPWCATYCGRN
jgi:ABC-type nitrate/sulfonate/bicarbonate transport system substrate-binding protein